MKQLNIKHVLRMICALMLFTAITPALVSCEEDEPDENQYAYDIRGYWISDRHDLALEVISQEEYFKMKGEESSFNGLPSNNVYQLWSIKDDAPECLLKWTTCSNYFYFEDSNDWYDKPYISHYTDDELYLDGLYETYYFRRVTQQEFDRIVKRSGNNNGNNNDNNGNKTDIASIVKNNTQCTATYSDYYVNIEIKHTLLSKLPNANISYVVGHAEKGSSTCYVATGNHRFITSDISTTGELTTFKMSIPFYYYYFAKWIEAESDPDKEEYYKKIVTNLELYFTSYEALKNMSSLSESQQELLDEFRKEFDKYQLFMKDHYTVWIYIEIDGKKYLLKDFNV